MVAATCVLTRGNRRRQSEKHLLGGSHRGNRQRRQLACGRFRRTMSTDTPQYGENAGGFGIRHFLLARRPAEEGEWYSLINAIPAAGSNSFLSCAGLSVNTTSQVGRTWACNRCPPCAVHRVFLRRHEHALGAHRLSKPHAYQREQFDLLV